MTAENKKKKKTLAAEENDNLCVVNRSGTVQGGGSYKLTFAAQGITVNGVDVTKQAVKLIADTVEAPLKR